MVERIVDWLITIMLVIFAVVAVVAGFRLVTSGGSPDAKTKAKTMMTNAIVGLVIILAAWIAIDTIMRSLVGSDTLGFNSTPWYQLECMEPTLDFGGSGGTSGGGAPDGGTGGGGATLSIPAFPAAAASCSVVSETETTYQVDCDGTAGLPQPFPSCTAVSASADLTSVVTECPKE
jgi:hypothetical protein